MRASRGRAQGKRLGRPRAKSPVARSRGKRFASQRGGYATRCVNGYSEAVAPNDRKRSVSCARCGDLDQEVPIRTPGELAKVIRVIRGNIDDGTIVVVPGQSFDLPEAGPWPDIIDFTFECRECRVRFSLAAEVYHGHGGAWSPVG